MVSWIFVHIGSGNGLLLLPNQCWFTVNKTPKNTCQWNHLVGDSMSWFLSWWPIHTIQTPMCCTVLWPSDAIWRYTCRSGVNIDSGIGLLSGGPKLSDGPKPLPDPMLTSHWWGSVASTWKQFHKITILYSEFQKYYHISQGHCVELSSTTTVS